MIHAWDTSSVVVDSTSVPLSSNSGVGWISLDDSTTLLGYDGVIGGISFYGSSVATLSGGSINAILSYQDVFNVIIGRDEDDNPIFNRHIEMIVRDWSHNDQTNLLTGTWNVDNDNDDLFDTFGIQLYDKSGYDPAIENITFTIIPEPATLLLFGLGGLILRKSRTRV